MADENDKNCNDLNQSEKNDKEKSKKCHAFKRRLKNMNNVVKELENSLVESYQNDRQLLMSANIDSIKNQKLTTQLEEARKENKQLLNIIQQRCSENDLSRTNSQYDLSPTYSVSIVHLQYKYEELLASHEGLLKVLETRLKENQKCCTENNELRESIKSLNFQLSECETIIQKLCDKYFAIKQRKDEKIAKLRMERNTLKLVHNQLVNLLHKQCMEKDLELTNELQISTEPNKSLLLKEIRRTNLLQYENAQLQQEITNLRSKLYLQSVNSK